MDKLVECIIRLVALNKSLLEITDAQQAKIADLLKRVSNLEAEAMMHRPIGPAPEHVDLDALGIMPPIDEGTIAFMNEELTKLKEQGPETYFGKE